MAIRSSIPMTFGEKAQEDFSVSHLQGEAAYRCGAHWHDCFELILVQKGTFTVILDGVPVGLAAGDLAVIPPHMLHATAGEAGAYDVLVLGYTEELIYSPEISIANLKFLLPFRWARPAEQWRIPDPGGLRKRFLDAAAAASKSAFHQSLIARSAILLLHAELYAYYMHDGAPEEKTEYSLAVERYIEEHITEDISPYAVAEALHISYSHLARLIKGDFGFPLGELICRMRVNYAEELMMEHPELPVTEIAMRLGFSSTSYFIRRFEELRGCTPGKFRKMLAAESGGNF